MIYLETLGESERFIISQIVEKWNQNVSCNGSAETRGIKLFSLIDAIGNNDDGLHWKEIFFQVDQEGGQIDTTQIYDLNLAQSKYGADYKHQIERLSKQRFYSVIVSLCFIQSLFKNGLIYFTEENIEPTSYEEWDVPSEKDYPKTKYMREVNSFFSMQLCQFLNSFLGSPIIPGHQLLNLYDNNFKTSEQTRFKQSQCLSKLGILTAIIIALVSPWLLSKCSHTAIKQEQIDSIIYAIPSERQDVYLNEGQFDSIVQVIKNFKGKDISNE